jgi:hypothetical protein
MIDTEFDRENYNSIPPIMIGRELEPQDFDLKFKKKYKCVLNFFIIMNEL